MNELIKFLSFVRFLIKIFEKNYLNLNIKFNWAFELDKLKRIVSFILLFSYASSCSHAIFKWDIGFLLYINKHSFFYLMNDGLFCFRRLASRFSSITNLKYFKNMQYQLLNTNDNFFSNLHNCTFYNLDSNSIIKMNWLNWMYLVDLCLYSEVRYIEFKQNIFWGKN